jgi:uncharacterized membrane protein YqgA involved in biofilm formation
MIGTELNAAGILAGGAIGLARRKPLSPATESRFRIGLGVFTVFYGLRLTWISLHGSFGQLVKQVLIMMVALILGRITGRLLRLQAMSNQLGRAARQNISAARPDDPQRIGLGFKTCSVLFCAAPLGILGAIQDGLPGEYYYPLAVKAVMDGLATMGFVSIFGWGSLLSAVAVLAFQGSITLTCSTLLGPFLKAHDLVDPVNATGGMLVFCVALIILDLKTIHLADYLPSLAFAPLLAWAVT